MFTAGGGLEGAGEHGAFQAEIQKAGASDFHLLAQITDVKFGEHVGGKPARIHFPRPGQRHERVALVVAEFRIRTRTDENSGCICIRQDGEDGLLQFQLNLFIRQHGNYLTTDGHGLLH